ncbi:MAG: GNAT family N-acetyltransferase [Clostridia bacterium]|nr:GNAT family N-acetyltransferase [Clostridia bacterium]
MEILEYYKLSDEKKEYWKNELLKCDWDAGQYLHSLLDNGEFKSFCGENAEVLLAVEGDSLTAFCTLAEHDEIVSDEMKPWIGFVYTFPQFRGRRLSGLLTERAVGLAAEAGYEYVYVSSEEKGLYEKYGFEFLSDAMSEHGYMTQIFRRKLK